MDKVITVFAILMLLQLCSADVLPIPEPDPAPPIEDNTTTEKEPLDPTSEKDPNPTEKDIVNEKLPEFKERTDSDFLIIVLAVVLVVVMGAYFMLKKLKKK